MPEASSCCLEAPPHAPSPADDLPSRLDLLCEWLAGEPLVSPAIGMAAGIWLDSVRHVPLALSTAISVACGLVLSMTARRERLSVSGRLPRFLTPLSHLLTRHILIAIAAAAVGATLHDSAYRRWPQDHVARFCASPASARLTGTVQTSPILRRPRTGRIDWLPQQPQTRFMLAAERLQGITGEIAVSGQVAVTVAAPVPHLRIGDRITVIGTLYRPPPPDNPGQRDWSRIHRRNGILACMNAEFSANITTLAPASSAPWLIRLRHRARAAILDGTYPEEVPGSQLLQALVLGQRSAVDPEVNEAFVSTGTVHYLSVSGAHIGMLASAVWGIAWLLGASRRKAAFAAMLLLTAYAVLAEPNAPIIRAALMGDLLCLAMLLRRPIRTANWLALSAVVLLAFKPTQLFDPGFQLSFATLISVIYLSRPVHCAGRRFLDLLLRRSDPLLMPEVQRKINPPRGWKIPALLFADALGWSLAVAIAAWLVGAVAGSYHFGQVAVWGWLNTVLLMPAFWLVLVIGLLKTVLAGIHPLAGALGWCLSHLTDGLIRIVRVLAGAPGANFTPPALPLWLVALALTVMFLWVLTSWLRLRTRWVMAVAAAVVLIGGWRLAPYTGGDAVRVHVLSVGQGLCCLVQLPDGKAFLYDAGAQPPFDIERWTLGPLLARERIYALDAVVISHPDLDHFSAIPDVLQRRPVRAVITPPQFDFGSHSERLRQEFRAAGVERLCASTGQRILCQPGRRTTAGQAAVEVLWPPPPAELTIPRSNDASLVLRISYAGRRLLLCGDIEDFAVAQLLGSEDLRADVLLVPHHGSPAPATAALLQAVRPSFCICSEGARVQDSEWLARIPQGATWLSTADRGCIEVTLGHKGISAMGFRQPDPGRARE